MDTCAVVEPAAAGRGALLADGSAVLTDEEFGCPGF